MIYYKSHIAKRVTGNGVNSNTREADNGNCRNAG